VYVMSLWESLDGESVKIVSAEGSKFPGGLYLVSIELRPDRVACSVFTSRPTLVHALRERLTLSDSAGTEYVMQPSDHEIIDGKGVVEFAPGLPPDATRLTFGVPGSWFTVATLREQSAEAE
jgi:hypothetical protein